MKRGFKEGSGTLLRFLVVLSMVLIGGFALVASSDARAATDYDAEELEFLDLINAYRAGNGAGPLILSDDLAVAAEHHNRDMGTYNFFAHDTVQSSYYPVGSEPWDRMAAEGYSYETAKGENLAAGYETAEEVIAAWKASPSHNAAMLDPEYRVIGISRLNVPGSESGWYWSTGFGAYEDPSSHEPGEPPAAEETTGVEQETERPVWNGIQNGGFVGREFWEESARDGAKLILRGQFVRLGGYNNGFDEVRQRVSLRDGAVLEYGMKVSSPRNGDADDRLRVRLTDEKGETVAVLRRYSGEDKTDGWVRQRVELPVGKKNLASRDDLYLSFVVRTDGRAKTFFFLDNVSVTR